MTPTQEVRTTPQTVLWLAACMVPALWMANIVTAQLPDSQGAPLIEGMVTGGAGAAFFQVFVLRGQAVARAAVSGLTTFSATLVAAGQWIAQQSCSASAAASPCSYGAKDDGDPQRAMVFLILQALMMALVAFVVLYMQRRREEEAIRDDEASSRE